ncbi:MAG: DNA replication/repair protein RecF [Clostridia bacterium]|nr:DNA replication/repair protein RecF [Clostridia bacterium]
MICESVQLHNYRNLGDTDLSFSEGINVLWGRNAQGKSNLLESIYFFARGKSFRLSKDRDLIAFGREDASFGIVYRYGGQSLLRSLRADLSQTGKRRLFEDGASVRTSEMIGRFRAVFFGPFHLSLVSGPPAMRRSYLDVAVSQLRPSYVEDYARYQRFLSERNALIRKASSGENVSLSEWETYAEGLAEYGSRLVSARTDYLRGISGVLSRIFSDMTDGKENPGVVYESHGFSQPLEILSPDGSSFPGDPDLPEKAKRILFGKLTDDIDRDLKAGTTLHGPHKDDLSLTINRKDSRYFASQGQQRSMALALKLAEGEYSRTVTGEYPVFLLDDVLSELDSARRQYILRSLGDKQIFVSSCDPALFESVGPDARMFRVEDGSVSPFS